MLTTVGQRLVLIWLLLGSIAAGVAALSWPAAHLGSELIPAGNDSFYHARRILDAARDPASFYQFDKKIHAPEGSLLTWPWGYDYALGMGVRLGSQLSGIANPMEILIWIPVAAVFLSVGLMMLLARRLSFSLWSTVLAGLCVTFSPLTQFLHGVGNVDHHFAEYIFVLLSLCTGLHWLDDLNSAKRAATAGLILGIAPAIHNGLFILQIPLLATLLLHWLQGRQMPRRPVLHFAVALVTATTAILLPSLPFRLGRFEYFTLSWFHLYVAFGTAIIALVLTLAPKTKRNLLVFGATAILLSSPLLHQILAAKSFLTGSIIRLSDISEMRSLPRQVLVFPGLWATSNMYTLFVWLLPLTSVYCVYKGWQERCSARLLFWLSSVGGLLMLVLQFRLHYFGSFALYLPWLVMLEEFVGRKPNLEKQAKLGASLLVLLLYGLSLRYQISAAWAPGNDPSFRTLRPIFTTLAEACARQPGVVLADNDAGHYIRYYTDCSVIVNNFLLTPQHADKIREMDKLLSLKAKDLPVAAPYVSYLLLRPATIQRIDEGYRYVSFSPASSDLLLELLMEDPPEDPRYKLIDEIVLPESGNVPYARLYRIDAAN